MQISYGVMAACKDALFSPLVVTACAASMRHVNTAWPLHVTLMFDWMKPSYF